MILHLGVDIHQNPSAAGNNADNIIGNNAGNNVSNIAANLIVNNVSNIISNIVGNNAGNIAGNNIGNITFEEVAQGVISVDPPVHHHDIRTEHVIIM